MIFVPRFCGETEIYMEHTVYFDNAATTYPKPQSVLSAAFECMQDYCGNPGRGSHTLAMRSSEKVFEAREKLADLFGAESERVIFTLNTTYALNMAIKGVLGGGGHVLISNMEHNSVLRPIAALARGGKVRYDVFTAYSASRPLTPEDIISSIISKLKPDTRMLVCTHSSNICSYTLPIREIGAFCRRHGIIFAVDAAQSAGHLPIDMRADNIDLLAMPAHKGLYAPQGCGILMLSPRVRPATIIEGGNGINSLDSDMGSALPERYEAGTLCTPAIAGLCAALDFISGIGTDTVARHERELFSLAREGLSRIQGVSLYAAEHTGSVLLFNVDGIDPDEVGGELSHRGFCLRSGYHCASLAHKALGTPRGGALRLSFGFFNTEAEVELLLREVDEIARDR